MNQYLLDTNICIYYIKGLHNLKTKFEEISPKNCFISEINLAELKFGVAKSEAKKKNQKALENFLSGIQILPFFRHLISMLKKRHVCPKVGMPATQKSGKIIDDFDLLIGATAVSFDLIMVTNNTSHFSRIKEIVLEDWSEL